VYPYGTGTVGIFRYSGLKGIVKEDGNKNKGMTEFQRAFYTSSVPVRCSLSASSRTVFRLSGT
jgi:hypothetical protein